MAMMFMLASRAPPGRAWARRPGAGPSVAGSAAAARGLLRGCGHLVARLLDRGGHRGVVERALGADGHRPGGQIDLDARDTGHLGDLLGDRADAVCAGHTRNGVDGRRVGRARCHDGSLLVWTCQPNGPMTWPTAPNRYPHGVS